MIAIHVDPDVRDQLRYGPHPAPDARGDAGGLTGDARRLPVFTDHAVAVAVAVAVPHERIRRMVARHRCDPV